MTGRPPDDDDDEGRRHIFEPGWDIDRCRDTEAAYEALQAAKAGPTQGDEAHSWAHLDLTVIGTEGVAKPAHLRRTDGVHLIYPGKVSWWSGDSEVAKGWILTQAATEVLGGGGRVAWLDFEDDATTLVERLAAVGVTRDVINDPDRVRYYNPSEPLWDHDRATPACADFAILIDWAPELVIIDGVTEALTVEGLSPDHGTDIAAWLQRIPRHISAVGSAVQCVDHVVKNTENRGRYAIGSQHKLAGVDGASFIIEAVTRFGRAHGSEPVEGMSRITLAKDRPGWLRGHLGKDQPMADVALTAYPDGGVTVNVQPPGQGARGEHERRIAEHLAIYEGASKTHLRELGNSQAIDEALKVMVGAGHVVVEKVGNAHQHTLTDTGRDHYEVDG